MELWLSAVPYDHGFTPPCGPVNIPGADFVHICAYEQEVAGVAYEYVRPVEPA